MKRKAANLQLRLYFITVIVTLAGLGCALYIYLTVGGASDDVVANEAEYSKMYVHDLELYGGKINVLADEFNRWFAGLWHGQSLAFTVAFITIIVSLGLFLAAYHLPTALKPGDGEENNGGGSD